LPEPAHELLDQRPVEAEVLTDLRDVLAGGVVAGDDRRRIPRAEPESAA
jgi:hypothetical protein